MKVLYFMNHAGTGGAALALYDLIVELKKRHDLKIVVITGKMNELNEMLTEIEVENYSAPFKNFMSSERKPVWLWRFALRLRHDVFKPLAIRKIEKLIDFSTVDIIHSNLNRIDIGAYFSQKYQIPHVWHIREHAEGDFTLIPIYKDYVAYMNQFQSCLVAISKSVRAAWMERGISECKLIYDGVRAEKLQNCHPAFDGKLKILFLGGYNGTKGQEFLIDAVATLEENIRKDLTVDFYGSGFQEKKSALEKKIKQYSLESCLRLHPYDPQIYSRIGDYNIGINCSVSEGFGRVTVEYMMAGLCVIASDSGANPELIENGKTGLLYSCNDRNDLADQLRYLYHNREICKMLGIRAKEAAISSFSMERHANRIWNLYQELKKT